MKKIFGFAAVIAMVAAVNVRMSSSNNEELTALQLENIEYLAEAERTHYEICDGKNSNPCVIAMGGRVYSWTGNHTAGYK